MNIGILGAGNIAGSMARTICGMAAQGRPVTLCAVASRSQEKADAFAKAYGIPRAYGSYAAMLNDPLVELVYIATPHSHHAEQIRQCVAAGKPVLCEKSFTANAKQAEEVLQEAEAAGVYVAEAIWTRYMPARGMIADIIVSGEIGEPRFLSANLAYDVEHKERISQPELAGGALLDVGVYPLNFASMVFGNDIVRVESSVQKLGTGVDRTESITYFYRDGKMAQLMASVVFNSDRRGIVYGTKGFLTVDNVTIRTKSRCMTRISGKHRGRFVLCRRKLRATSMRWRRVCAILPPDSSNLPKCRTRRRWKSCGRWMRCGPRGKSDIRLRNQ